MAQPGEHGISMTVFVPIVEPTVFAMVVPMVVRVMLLGSSTLQYDSISGAFKFLHCVLELQCHLRTGLHGTELHLNCR